jgi:hypothetical protein
MIAGLSLAEDMDNRRLCLLCVFIGSCLCDELIARSEESYPVFVCVCKTVCDLETSTVRCRRPDLNDCATERKSAGPARF